MENEILLTFNFIYNLAQYGASYYGSNFYSDGTGADTGSELADTGTVILPSFIFGIITIALSIWLITRKNKKQT